MSGHSKWSTIKHKKASTDQKRADAFSKIVNAITIAARKGGDLDVNYELRSVVEKAKKMNMPKDNIERSIKKGTGELGGAKLEELLVEAYGPSGVAFLIDIVTDNRNRTAAELRHLLSRNKGKIATEGSVQWLFEQQGVIEVKIEEGINKDDFELMVIDKGVIDIAWEGNTVFVYTKREDLQYINSFLISEGYDCNVYLEWSSKDSVQIDNKTQGVVENIFELLNDRDDVQNVYTNAK